MSFCPKFIVRHLVNRAPGSPWMRCVCVCGVVLNSLASQDVLTQTFSGRQLRHCWHPPVFLPVGSFVQSSSDLHHRCIRPMMRYICSSVTYLKYCVCVELAFQSCAWDVIIYLCVDRIGVEWIHSGRDEDGGQRSKVEVTAGRWCGEGVHDNARASKSVFWFMMLYVTSALKQLHWLPVASRIKLKLCLFMHLIHLGRPPQYLVGWLTVYR